MNIKTLLSICLVALLAACGGGDDDAGFSATDSAADAGALDKRPVAKSLTYVDPAGTGWRLVKDASSTPTRVVLNLVGPAGQTARGVGFNLRKGRGVAFSPFPNGAYALDTGVFELKGSNSNFEPYAGTAADPVLFVSAPLKSGEILSSGIFQKDRTRVPKDLTKPLIQIALTLSTSAGRPSDQSADQTGLSAAASRSGDVIGLAVVKARMVPADIGGLEDFMLSPEVIAKAKMVDIPVAVGRLVAN
jgi:hypothetical protein